MGTPNIPESLKECGSNSVVECNLAKVEVEGSNPFSRSIYIVLSRAGHRRQVVRPRSAKSLSAVRVRPVPPFSLKNPVKMRLWHIERWHEEDEEQPGFLTRD